MPFQQRLCHVEFPDSHDLSLIGKTYCWTLLVLGWSLKFYSLTVGNHWDMVIGEIIYIYIDIGGYVRDIYGGILEGCEVLSKLGADWDLPHIITYIKIKTYNIIMNINDICILYLNYWNTHMYIVNHCAKLEVPSVWNASRASFIFVASSPSDSEKHMKLNLNETKVI